MIIVFYDFLHIIGALADIVVIKVKPIDNGNNLRIFSLRMFTYPSDEE